MRKGYICSILDEDASEIAEELWYAGSILECTTRGRVTIDSLTDSVQRQKQTLNRTTSHADLLGSLPRLHKGKEG